jgi:hypothetical protein
MKFIIHLYADISGPLACSYFGINVETESYRQVVGLRGRIISPSEGPYLHRTTQTERKLIYPCHDLDSNSPSQCSSGPSYSLLGTRTFFNAILIVNAGSNDMTLKYEISYCRIIVMKRCYVGVKFCLMRIYKHACTNCMNDI